MEAAMIIGLLLIAWIALCTTVQIGITLFLLWESTNKQPKFMVLPPELQSNLQSKSPVPSESTDSIRNYL